MKSNNAFPKISVITPSYNQGKFIERTILSVIEQNYPNLEYIIIDGGSTDETISIIKKYETKIAYWISEKDSGQANAINKGLKKCSGDIIGWLNSDDVYEEKTLFYVAENFNSIEKPFLLSANFRSIDEDDKIIWESKKGINAAYQKKYSEMNLLQCWKNTLPQPSTFWAKGVTDKLGLLNEDLHFAMDLEYWLRCIKNEIPIYFSEEIYSSFRRHSNAKSSVQVNVLQKDLNYLKSIYLNSIVKRVYYSILKYIWFYHSYKIREAILWTKINPAKAINQLCVATIAFPLGVFMNAKYYAVFAKQFIFLKGRVVK